MRDISYSAEAAPPTAAGKRPRAPAHDEEASVGVAFEEGGVDCEEDLDEEGMGLARNKGLDLALLECSSAAEVQSWIKESRFR